jgi:hypothetical protein
VADWILIPAGHSLFAAFDELAPGRDHASDGSIGDAAHAAEVSDHNPDETGAVPIHDADKINEVHAVDIDSDLRTDGVDMETVVQFILARCRAGAEKRLRYVIYARRIWEADNEWRERAYTGSSAHLEHAHFSFSYVTALEASTVSWHLEEIPVVISDSQIDDIADRVLTKAAITGIPAADGTATWSLGSTAKNTYVESKNGHTMGDRNAATLADLTSKIDALTAAVAALAAAKLP